MDNESTLQSAIRTPHRLVNFLLSPRRDASPSPTRHSDSELEESPAAIEPTNEELDLQAAHFQRDPIGSPATYRTTSGDNDHTSASSTTTTSSSVGVDDRVDSNRNNNTAAALDPDDSDDLAAHMSTLTVGGIQLAGVPNTTKPQDSTAGVLHSQSDRPEAGTKESIALLSLLTAKNDAYAGGTYQRFADSFDSPEALDAVLASQLCVEATATCLQTFDLLLYFQVAFPISSSRDKCSFNCEMDPLDSTKIKQVNLLTSASELSVKQVVASSIWYNTYFRFPGAKNIIIEAPSELNMAFAHFQAHVDLELFGIVCRQHEEFPVKSQGGPLFFKLLIDSLHVSNEANLLALESSVLRINIATMFASDVRKAMKTIKAAIAISKGWRIRCGMPVLPVGFEDNILTVLETTGCALFTARVDLIKSTALAKRMENMIKSPVFQSLSPLGAQRVKTIHACLNLAILYYDDLVAAVKWVVAPVTPASSSFVTTSNCWNCNKPGCRPDKCDIAVDDARVKANRKKFYEANPKARRRKKGKGRPEYFRLPAPSENNRRVITLNNETAKWTFDPATKRWLKSVPVDDRRGLVVSTTPNANGGTVGAGTQAIAPSNGDDYSVLTSGTSALTIEDRQAMKKLISDNANSNAFIANLLRN